MRLSEWAEHAYTDASRPCAHTLRRMARDGEIKGAVRTKSKRWYVDVSARPCANRDSEESMVGDDPILRKAAGL